MKTKQETKNYDIFISYSSLDGTIAEEMKAEFENHKITYWLDVDNLYKKDGGHFKRGIQKAILESQALFVIFSENANKSDFIIENEVSFAKANNIPILFFPIDNKSMSRETMDPRLLAIVGDIQWVCNAEQMNRIPDIREAYQGLNRKDKLQKFIDGQIKFKEGDLSINLFLARIAVQRFLEKPIATFGTYTSLENNSSIYSRNHVRMVVKNKEFIWAIPESRKEALYDFIQPDKVVNMPALNENIEPDRESIKQQLIDFVSKYYKDDIPNIPQFLEIAAIETADDFIEELKVKKLMFNGSMLGIYDIRVNRSKDIENHLLDVDFYKSDYFTFKFTVKLYHKLRTIHNRFEINKTPQVSSYAPFLCSLGMGGYIVVKHKGENYLMWTKRSANISAGEMWHFSYDETVSLAKDIIRDGDNKIVRNDEGEIMIDPYLNYYRGIKEENGLLKRKLTDKGGIFEIGLITSDRLEIEMLSYAEVKLEDDASIEDQIQMYTDSADDRIEIDKIKYVKLSKKEITKEFVGQLLTPESYALAERLLVRYEK